MKIQRVPALALLLALSAAAFSQDDVNLFDFWKYYSDAENAMYKTSCKLAFKQLSERKSAIARLQSNDDYLNRREEIKDKLLRLIGPFPQKTPLNAHLTGVIRKEDYRVEKLVYESLPGYYVTAALFLPEKREGKAPAIIYACGHTQDGFRSETYQHVIINLVKKGFIVLAFDPVGQGERLQYYTEEEGRSRFGPTTEHSYPGAQCYISGYSPTKYFIWDAIRGVDYLLTRKEVDPERIGMTGRSGGGTQTAFTAAVEDRILAAAPECFITSMEYVLRSIGPQDAEQNLYHMISEGIDHADLLEVRAPRPALMITTTRDFFSIQGARETYAEAKQFYAALGAGGKIHMVEDDTVHASTKKNREAMYAFFQQYLDLPGSSEDLEVAVLDAQELWVTETGQLATSLKGETIYSLNKYVADNQLARLKQSRSSEDFDEHVERVVMDAERLSGFIYPGAYGNLVFSGRYANPDYVLEKYLVPGSGDYVLPAALYKPIGTGQDELVLILGDQGMEQTAANDNLLIHSIVEQGYSVLLLDVPGIGSLGPGYLKGDAYIDNTSYNQWFAGIHTDKSIVGMRAEDIIRVIRCIKPAHPRFRTIAAMATGPLGSELLHAAVFDDVINKVCLVRPFLSFADIARSRNYLPAFIPSTVSGAIESYDLPDLMAALCPRKVLIINPLSAEGKPAGDDEKSCNLAYPRIVYTQKGIQGNFEHVVLEKGLATFKQLADWLK